MANHIPIYQARAHLLPITLTTIWDTNIQKAVAYLTRTTHPFTEATAKQIHLPLRLGGLGIAELTNRSATAYVGSWSKHTFEHNPHHITSDTQFCHKYPEIQISLTSALSRIQHTLPADHPPANWNTWQTDQHSYSQKHLTHQLNQHLWQQTNELTNHLQHTILNNAIGPAAGAWLYLPSDATMFMPDTHYYLALRTRLALHTTTTANDDKCNHHNEYRKCDHLLDTHGHHALTCNIGPQRTQRHNNIARQLAWWLKQHGHTITTEHTRTSHGLP